MERCPRLRAVLFALPLAVASPAHAQTVGGSIGVASEYIYRGVSQSDGDPSAQVDVHYYGQQNWYAGFWAASVRRGDDHTTAELNAYLGYNFAIAADWNGSLSLVHYDYPWNHPRRSYAYDEITATLAYGDRVFVSVAASPDTSFERNYDRTARSAAFAYDLALHQPLFAGLSADAGVGYYDVRRQLDAGYAYYSGGLGYRWRSLQLQLLYIGTNPTAKRLFYEDAAHQWTLAALWRF